VTDNKINQTYSCSNPLTLRRILKGMLGFKGFVVSDWGAAHGPSLPAGLDWVPGPSWNAGNDGLAAAVGNKSAGPFNFPGSSGFFRANDDRCSDGEGVCLTGGDFVPFVFNESSSEYLSVAVDGAVQTLRLLSSLPDVHTAATVLRRGLKGVRVDVVSGNNSARNGEHDRLQQLLTIAVARSSHRMGPRCSS
jgi:hypothetical protein